jgi:hypothetical protein
VGVRTPLTEHDNQPRGRIGPLHGSVAELIAMSKTKSNKSKPPRETFRVGRAPAHATLVNNLVHVFVDDQNLFYQIVHHEVGRSFCVDFGRLLLEVCKDTDGKVRGVGSAYIAGVVPDDDSFWKIADAQGFTVRRGYLGTGNRSKQDDAYLITDIMETLYEQPGPSTMVLVAGDADIIAYRRAARPSPNQAAVPPHRRVVPVLFCSLRGRQRARAETAATQ